MEYRRSWEMFKHYNIATVMIDSPTLDNLTWIDKVKEIAAKTNTLRIYFNNHYGGKAVINALQFKEMLELPVTNKEKIALDHAKKYYSKTTLDTIKDQ